MKKQPLGRMAVFLIPSFKLKKRNDDGKTVEDMIHQFLIKNFSGYTVEAGNIFGYWRNEDNEEEYGEHRRFTVAFKGKEKIPILEEFLVKIAKLIDENCIYLETGEDAWLVYAND